MRLLAAVFAVCLCASAQTTLNIRQLTSFLKSSVALRQDDRQVARFLSKVKLTEKLDDRTIEELQGYGLGSKTVEALQALRDATASLRAPAPEAPQPVVQPVPPPSPEEQQRVLQEVRENAQNYTRSLPDFICTQVTRRYYDPTGLEFWQHGDTLTTRLSYFEQKEDYKLILINNQTTNRSYESLGGAISTGEFGSMLREIFEPRTQTRFQWNRWATLRAKRAHVFEYRVAQPNSEWSISYGEDRSLRVMPGYHGLVYVERDTNMVLRVTLEAEDIPPSFPVQQAATTLDYDYSKIGDRSFLLPLKAVVRMRSGKYLSRNDVEFRMYRKFSADATVTFDTPPPLPEDKEQPAK
ncbi:MAG TPA: hypothetical protein VFA33_12210 [Bryobacteraceae bacterium]|nr:hypothetical protein [Bryobacteraceae bacterium]